MDKIRKLLIPKKLKFVSKDMYYEMTKNIMENKEREEFNRDDKINQQFKETRKKIILIFQSPFNK